jgi:GNAT superfamily N-acetyltransferase
MECRPATRADTWAVARLLVQLYEAEAPGLLTGDPEHAALRISRALEHDGGPAPLGTYYLLTRGDVALGVGAVATAECPVRGLWGPGPTDPADALLHSMVVDRGVRRTGVGTHLLRSLEDQAARRGKRNLLLYLRSGNPAELFYERFGYQTIRTTDGAVAMRKPLFERPRSAVIR